MAERKNFLDREKEKRDGENYLPYSIAPIPGLTALEQDALVKDVAEGLVKRNVEALQFDPYEPESIYAAIERRKVADNIEHGIQRMPEPLRDSWLISATEGAPPLFFGEVTRKKKNIPEGVGGFYDPEYNRVFIDKDKFQNRPFIAIHENAHKTNHDINLKHPFYERVDRTLVPDRMVGISLGNIVDDEFPKTIETRKGPMDRMEFIDEIEGILKGGSKYASDDASSFLGDALFRSGLVNLPNPSKVEKSKQTRHDWKDFKHQRDTFLDDVVNLSPNFDGRKYFNDLAGVVTSGHDRAYMREHGYNANRQEFRLLEKGISGRDFLEHNPSYASLSTEAAAELAELMATEGGEEYVKKRFPRTYERMMEEYRNDPRRAWPKGRLQAWNFYSHESPINLYKQRGGEPVAFNPNEERRYTRVPDPYGGWYYGDDYYDVRKNALRQKKNYVEYRDLEGNWKRYYPDELKHVNGKLTTTKDFAKMLGKKLLKGVK